jgi:hypothetical protein
MKNEPLSRGNKWILFGSIVVLAFIIYFVWFHQWDAVEEKFQETQKSTVDPACKSNLETVLREWLKKTPVGLTDSNTELGNIAVKCIHPFSLNTNGEKDQYYTSYGQFLSKLVGDSQIFSKYMDFNYDAVLSGDFYSTTDPNTKEGFAREFLLFLQSTLTPVLVKIRNAINNNNNNFTGSDYDQIYLNNTVLYIDGYLTRYQELKSLPDMKMGASNPIMQFLKSPEAMGFRGIDINRNMVKQWLPSFAEHIFQFQGVSGADTVNCNISPDILETSSQALKTMAACNFVVALYRERARLRKLMSSTDPQYMLVADDIMRVVAKFTDGLSLGVSIQNKIFNEYYKPFSGQTKTNWNNIIDGEIAEVNGGIRLRSANDSNRPGPPIPNPKIYDELMNLNTKCKAINTKDTRCADLVRVVCQNINNLMIMAGCTVPNVPEFVLSPPIMTSIICGPNGTITTTTTSPHAGTTTTTSAAAGTTTTTSAAAGTTTSTQAAAGPTTSAADLALDTTYQELYNLLRSKLGVLYDGREGDLSNDLIKLIQTMGPVERASLCQVYCNLKQECSQLCKELKCPNCFITQLADSDAEGQPGTTLGFAGIHDAYTLLDYLKGDYLGIKPNVESTTGYAGSVPYQSGARGPVINQKDTNGISNVFAPYIVMMPKRPGDSYGSYVLNDPNDPAYRDFIDKLVNNY